MTVLAAFDWNTNADLIVDCVALGYLKKDWVTLDPTYGEGNWWVKWRPDVLVKHDKFKLDGVDFRHLPHPDCMFDAVAYDPPYVCIGGRETSTITDMHHRFGMNSTPKTPQGVQDQMNDGLTEIYRVTRRK